MRSKTSVRVSTSALERWSKKWRWTASACAGARTTCPTRPRRALLSGNVGVDGQLVSQPVSVLSWRVVPSCCRRRLPVVTPTPGEAVDASALRAAVARILWVDREGRIGLEVLPGNVAFHEDLLAPA